MHRKVQVFSMPGKVSIGQDRNKKDPHRGRKPDTKVLSIEWEKPSDRNKKEPHRGRSFFSCVILIYKKRGFLSVMLEGSRTSISNVYISVRKFEKGEQK